MTEKQNESGSTNLLNINNSNAEMRDDNDLQKSKQNTETQMRVSDHSDAASKNRE